jgi:hypothetical protein
LRIACSQRSASSSSGTSTDRSITQARYYAPARDYLDRKRAEGKSRREALRCLKRQLVRAVFNTLKASPALT